MALDNAPGIHRHPKNFCGECKHFQPAGGGFMNDHWLEICAVATEETVTTYLKKYTRKRTPAEMNRYNNCGLFESKFENFESEPE